MQISRVTLGVEEVAIDSCLVDSVKLPLIAVEICFSQGPGLREGQFLQMISYIDQLVVWWFESAIDLALSVELR